MTPLQTYSESIMPLLQARTKCEVERERFRSELQRAVVNKGGSGYYAAIVTDVATREFAVVDTTPLPHHHVLDTETNQLLPEVQMEVARQLGIAVSDIASARKRTNGRGAVITVVEGVIKRGHNYWLFTQFNNLAQQLADISAAIFEKDTQLMKSIPLDQQSLISARFSSVGIVVRMLGDGNFYGAVGKRGVDEFLAHEFDARVSDGVERRSASYIRKGLPLATTTTSWGVIYDHTMLQIHNAFKTDAGSRYGKVPLYIDADTHKFKNAKRFTTDYCQTAFLTERYGTQYEPHSIQGMALAASKMAKPHPGRRLWHTELLVGPGEGVAFVTAIVGIILLSTHPVLASHDRTTVDGVKPGLPVFVYNNRDGSLTPLTSLSTCTTQTPNGTVGMTNDLFLQLFSVLSTGGP
jgi:hypothetical protein